MNFDYVFHDKGVSINKVEEGHLWLDIGNTLEPGVIDHHSSTQYSCTVEALVNNLNFIDHLKNNEQVTFHSHKYPDIDALFSIYLVQYYLNNNHLPRNIETILDYASSVGKGHIRLADGQITLYTVICFMSEQYNYHGVLNQCFNLINNAVQRSENNAGFSFMDSDVSDLLSGLSGFDDIKAEILNDYQLYKSERDNRDICDVEDIFLPLSHSTAASTASVKALIWKKKPVCEFNRIWARSEGFVLTVVPQDDKEFFLNGNTIPCTDTIVSIHPNAPYSLRPLAHLLEQCEQDKENSVLGDNSSRKRDHSSPRGKPEDGNRFYENPWDTTSDPWYFSSDHTLVQSPHSGSLLSTSEVIHVVKTFGQCLIKGYRANVIVPFTYTPSHYKEIVKWFTSNGWKQYGNTDIDGGDIPWLNKEKRYVNTLLEEYSFPLNKQKRHFAIIEAPLYAILGQGHAMCSICNFDKECYNVLFEHGAGVTVFTSTFNQPDKCRLASLEIEKLNTIQSGLYNYLANNYLYEMDLLYCLAPHFYTSIEVSSECLKLSNSIIEQYSEMMCDIFDNNISSFSVDNLNYRTVLANSRLGSVIVIVTDKHEDANRKEKRYRELFENEWLYMYIIALQQRYSLLEIKRSFTSLSDIGNNKNTRLLRDALIKFYATSYFTTATDDELGDNLFRKWHEIHMIDDLKTDIMEQINQHDEYQSSKLSNFFSIISALILPVVFLSTIVQTALIQLKPLIISSDSGLGITLDIKMLPAWAMVYTPVFVLIAITVWFLKKKKK
jgi:hypothetical protein